MSGYEWLIPLVVPFIIGLLVGVIIKKTVKIIFVLVALVIVLVATGALSIGVSDLWSNATELLPKIADQRDVILNVLPYTSAGFLIGLALGLWRG